MKRPTRAAFALCLIFGFAATAFAQLPVANFQTTLTSKGGATDRFPLVGRFDAAQSISQTWSSTDNRGITDYVWTFGDGSTIWTKLPVIDHVFLWPGNFSVTLTVTNSAGRASSATSNVSIAGKDTAFAHDVFHVKITGNDTSGDGSFANPWRTIAKALTRVTAGDYVAVHSGVYNEYCDVSRDVALPNDRIHLVGYSAISGGFKIRTPNYTIDGFDLNFSNLSAQGALYLYEGAHNTRLLNNTIHDGPSGRNAIYVSGDSVPDKEPSSGCLNGVVHNNVMRNIRWICVELVNGMNWRITGNQVYHTESEGDFVRPHGAGHVVADNYCYDLQNGGTGGHPDCFQVTGQTGFQARDIVLERNTFIGIPGNTNGAQICQTASLGVVHTNIIFRNNQFIDIRGQANIHADGFKFYNNLFYRCGPGVGQIIAMGGVNGSCYGTEIKNNIFFECGQPGSASAGWYENGLSPWATNVTISANYNFVCGTFGAPKQLPPPINQYRWGIPGQEENGINGGSPSFEDPERYGFRILPTSILAGKGVALSGFSDTLDGKPRSGRWSIGPFEPATLPVSIAPSSPANLRIVEAQ